MRDVWGREGGREAGECLRSCSLRAERSQKNDDDDGGGGDNYARTGSRNKISEILMIIIIKKETNIKCEIQALRLGLRTCLDSCSRVFPSPKPESRPLRPRRHPERIARDRRSGMDDESG